MAHWRAQALSAAGACIHKGGKRTPLVHVVTPRQRCRVDAWSAARALPSSPAQNAHIHRSTQPGPRRPGSQATRTSRQRCNLTLSTSTFLCLPSIACTLACRTLPDPWANGIATWPWSLANPPPLTGPTMQNFLALIPLALILGDVTEDLAVRFGDVTGGLINATFGNGEQGGQGLLDKVSETQSTAKGGHAVPRLPPLLSLRSCGGALHRSASLQPPCIAALSRVLHMRKRSGKSRYTHAP